MAEVITSTSPDIEAGNKCVTESASGAVGITRGLVIIIATSAVQLTLAAPTAGQDDGKELEIVSTTAYQHTIVTPSNGINGAYKTFTFSGVMGASVRFRAYAGVWWTGVTSGPSSPPEGGLS
jgi:hypothetical protein